MEAMPPCLGNKSARPDHVRPPSRPGRLTNFGRMIVCGDVEVRQIQMPKLQPLLMRILKGNGFVVDEMAQGQLHAHDNFIQRDQLDPSRGSTRAP